MTDRKESLEYEVEDSNISSKSGSGIFGFPLLLTGLVASCVSGVLGGVVYAHNPNLSKEQLKLLATGPVMSFVGGLITPRIGPFYPGAIATGLEAISFTSSYAFCKLLDK